MRWHSECQIPGWLQRISYTDQIFSMGSCFAQSIGQRLLDYGLRGQCNPFGVVYNPMSLALQLQRLLERRLFVQSDFFEHEKLWRQFQLHSSLAAESLPDAVSTANGAVQEGYDCLDRARWLMLTFGSAHIWEQLSTAEVVSNCHRLPQQQFRRRLAALSKLEEALVPVLNQLLERNPSLQLVVTVSPVRYLRDGLVASQRSKARLHELVQRLEYRLPERVIYFPAYELLIDELRDYRFTNRDLCHPSPEAEDHIWQRFLTVSTNQRCKAFFKQGAALHRLRMHKPLRESTVSAWQQQCGQLATQIKAQFPMEEEP